VLCETDLASLNEILEQALARLAEGYFEDAIDGFSEYLLIEPNEPKAYQGRAQANFQIKNWTAAISDFRRATELNPEDLESRVGWGTSLARVDQIYEAIDIFENLLAKSPHYVQAHIQLGALYYRLGIIKKGHLQMDLALAARPSLPERRLIERLKSEQMTLDKKRFYRPDFEELRRKSAERGGLIKRILDFIKNKFQNKEI